jgi:hypothetical protein
VTDTAVDTVVDSKSMADRANTIGRKNIKNLAILSV